MKEPLSGGYYKTFLLRIFFAFLLFTLTRILFFIFNHAYFIDIGFGEFLLILFYGLRFDLSAIIVCYSLFILLSIFPFHKKSSFVYQKILFVLYLISSTIALATNLLDCGYFRFEFSRSTADIFNVMGLGSDMKTLLPQYIKDFWYLFLIQIVLIVLTAWFFSKTKIVKVKQIKKEKLFYYYIKESLVFIIVGAFSIICFRGGLQLRPINIMSAGQYASAKNTALVLNTPFTIIKTIGKSGIDNNIYFNEKTLNKIYSPIHDFSSPNISMRKNNVVVIILESFGKEYFGELNKDNGNKDYKGFTPFLDSLIRESLVFTNAYANGKRSIEGIPAVLSGIPSLMNDAYITSMYSGDNFNSLASILKEKGYSTAFFHGGTNGTMGFDGYAKMAAFDKYYGRSEYNNEKDFDGKWGIFDEEFLQYVAGKFDESTKPFMAGIFTLSSHHPYTIPAKYKDKFPKGTLPIHQSIAYADYALRKFFETMSGKPWFDSTLFVITPDHTSESFYPIYQTRIGMYSIPIIFYQHNSKLRGRNTNVTQQIDIMPSILDFLHYDKKFFSFGESVFDITSLHFAISYVNESYQLIYKNYAFVFDGTNGISLYDITKDKFLKVNMLDKEPAIRKEMEEKIKAIIQTYNQRILKNNMIIKQN
jgi:phosphoglycerol transferase MdoB-like AlkP superfamily enzyme